MKKEIIRKECVVLKNPKPYGPVAKTEFGWTGMSLSIGVYEDYVNIHQNVMGKYSKLGVLTYDEPVKKILGLTFYYDFESREIVVYEEVGDVEILENVNKNDSKMIKVFKDDRFGEVRVSGTPDKPLFCLADVCKILGLSNPSSVAKRIDEEYRAKIDLGRDNQVVGNSMATFVTEPGLYSVILGSDSKNVATFKKWVFEEVLPAIRKTGGYVGDSYKFVDAYFGELDADTKKFMAITLDSKKKLMEENAIQLKVIEEQKPKVEFYNDVADSNGAHTMDEVAKILSYYGLGRNKLFEFLRDEKILMRNNIPYQKYVDSGYFRLIEQVYDNKGEKMVRIKTLVYQKGIDYIRKLLSNKLKN